MATYRITRFFADEKTPHVILARGLSLKAAREWCNNPQTSSSTATGPEADALTRDAGPWFDGFAEE
jgi:hypothetical protein